LANIACSFCFKPLDLPSSFVYMLLLNFTFLDRKGLLKMGIRGVTVSDIRGFGAQGGAKERQGGK